MNTEQLRAAPISSKAPIIPLFKNLAPADSAALLNFLSINRREPTKWYFFHVRIKDNTKMTLGEAYQLLDQNLMHNSPVFMKLDDRKELLAVCTTDTSQPFSVLENQISQALLSKDAGLQSNTLSERGIEQLGKIMESILPAGDMAAQIAWRRFTRLSNSIMVLDDDQVILRVMGHMLKNYGQVETFSTAKEFLIAYKNIAPNIVFLDINLGNERGTNVASLLSEKVDPGAYPIMISADAVKTNVIESKHKGAKGFMGKPINADALVRQVVATPSWYIRT